MYMYAAPGQGQNTPWLVVVERGGLLVEHWTPNREALSSIPIRNAVLELDTLCFEGPKEDWC